MRNETSELTGNDQSLTIFGALKEEPMLSNPINRRSSMVGTAVAGVTSMACAKPTWASANEEVRVAILGASWPWRSTYIVRIAKVLTVAD